MEFSDMDTAKKWYDSLECQEIVHRRTGNTISDLILVDQVGPAFTSAPWARLIRTVIAAAPGALA